RGCAGAGRAGVDGRSWVAPGRWTVWRSGAEGHAALSSGLVLQDADRLASMRARARPRWTPIMIPAALWVHVAARRGITACRPAVVLENQFGGRSRRFR